MFTGIIENTEKVLKIQKNNLIISSKIDNPKIGESISINGVCLTIINITPPSYLTFQLSQETLKTTTFKYIKPGEIVNVERALQVNQRLSGHILTGHIDTIGKITDIKKLPTEYIFKYLIPKEYSKYIVKKGSIGIDGISLTIVDIFDNYFTVNILPYTYEKTNLKFKKIGQNVNIEFDILIKYIERLLGKK